MRLLLLAALLCGPSVLAVESNWSVVLTDLGDQKIGVIKVVRQHTGLGLKETKDLVELPKPRVLQEGLSKSDAETFLAELAAVGAKAEVHAKGVHGPARTARVAALFEVRLDDAGANKLNVIKVLRAQTGLGLAESKTVIESAPVVLEESASREEAETMARELMSAGARVTLTKRP